MFKIAALALVLFSFSSWAKKAARVTADPEVGTERVIFHTNRGDLVFGLFPSVAPQTVAQILTLARAGVYTGVAIHRIEKGFVAQFDSYDGGAPITDEQRALVKRIPAEFSSVKHHRGTLSLARFDGDINSGESSFSILLGDAPHLDGQYTVFGKVVAGDDVVTAIENAPVVNQTTPTVDIFVKQVTVVNAGDLAQIKLQGVPPELTPNATDRTIFGSVAAFMFLLTVSMPIYKSVFAKV
jgi:cyclophilin family peptidyl-prolyl cis-trans isomerase